MCLETTYDVQLNLLPKLNWLPWIGQNYHQSKILILAESHYDDKGNWLQSRNATRGLVENQGLNSDNPKYKNRKLFERIEQTLLNKASSTLTERNALWNNVAFYNLVQTLLTSSKQRPTEQNYDDGWANFLQVAKVIKPVVCIKYGVEGIGRLGYLLNTTDTGWIRDDRNEFNIKPTVINLTNGSHKMRIIFTHHPAARGFSYSKWNGHIKKHFPEVESLFV